MPLFRKGRKKTGGRTKGARNKKTLSRIAEAEDVVATARAKGRKLAREVLEDYMELFSALAMTSKDNEAEFEKYARLTVETATALASYQSPKLKAVFVPLSQQQSSGAERLTREELAKKLEERGLPPMVFGRDKPKEIALVPEKDTGDAS
jgi:hypothetical protein